MEKNLILFGSKERVTALCCVAFEENVLCQVTFMCYVCVRNSCRSSTGGEGFDFLILCPKTGDDAVISPGVQQRSAHSDPRIGKTFLLSQHKVVKRRLMKVICYADGKAPCLKVTPYFSPFAVGRPLHALEPADKGLLLLFVALFQVVR